MADFKIIFQHVPGQTMENQEESLCSWFLFKLTLLQFISVSHYDRTLLCIREVMGLNLYQETDCTVVFCAFP